MKLSDTEKREQRWIIKNRKRNRNKQNQLKI